MKLIKYFSIFLILITLFGCDESNDANDTPNLEDKHEHIFIDEYCSCGTHVSVNLLSFKEICKNNVLVGYEIIDCEETAEEVVIPSKYKSLPVTLISENSFSECINLREIVIPETVTTIEERIFYGCENLEKLTMPSLKNITIEYLSNSFTENALKKSLKEVFINSGTEIGVNAFNGCKNLEKVTLPDSITNIKKSAFNGCSALKEINLPKNLKIIDSYAFANCKALEKIELPESIEMICSQVFHGCTALKYIIIPDDVILMGARVFQNCKSIFVYTNSPNIDKWLKIWSFLNTTTTNTITVYYEGEWSMVDGIPQPLN